LVVLAVRGGITTLSLVSPEFYFSVQENKEKREHGEHRWGGWRSAQKRRGKI